MHQRIAHIALVVRDYDEAIQFYTEKLDFLLVEDTKLTEEKRWVVVAPLRCILGRHLHPKYNRSFHGAH